MSLLDRIHAANRHDYSGFVPWYVAGERVGCVRTSMLDTFARWPEVFHVAPGALRLTPVLDEAPLRERTDAVGDVCATLCDEGIVSGWRDERYPVCRRWGEPPVVLVERAAAPLFGITAYGVHLNGLVRAASGEMHMWVARRSMSKPTGPGKLDQMVAGGQPYGIGLHDNLVKECAEEAGIPASIASNARAVGTITYVLETEQGMRPDVIFNFDLDVPADFEPVNTDGEVDDFYLWPLTRVEETLISGDAFKFNCALVAIDCLVRLGHISADHPDYEALVAGLHPDIHGVAQAWEDGR